MIIAQKIIGKIDPENSEQKHIIVKKNGEKYVGKITSLTKSKLTFYPDQLVKKTEISLQRSQIITITTFTPSDDNNGQLRKTFAKIKAKYPMIEMDPKLDENNYSQLIRLTFKRDTFVGRLFGIGKKGIELGTAKRVIFFPYDKIASIEVVNQNLSTVMEETANPFENTASIPKSAEQTNQIFDAHFDALDVNQQHLIRTKRGDQFFGHIHQVNEETVVLTMSEGSHLTFSKEAIKKVEVHFKGYRRKVKKGKFRYKKVKYFERYDYILAQNRLLVSPTGFGIKKGEWEYRLLNGVLNEIDYGITDNFTIGGGVFPLFFNNALTARLSINEDFGRFIHLSASAQILSTTGGFVSGDDNFFRGAREGFYSFHVASSIGTPNTYFNLTYHHWEGLFNNRKGDVFGIGYSMRLTKYYRFFTDFLYTNRNEFNVIFREDVTRMVPIYILGSSWFNQLSKLDFGVTVAPGNNDRSIQLNTSVVPFIGYMRRF